MSFFVSLLYPAIIILFSVFIYKIPFIKKLIKENAKILILFFFVCLFFGNVFLFLHLRQEQYIYFWDFSGFWRKSVEFNVALDKDVWDTLKMTYESMLYQEYSYFPEWFLSLPIMIIGNTFPRFVIAMFNFFVMPANLLLAIMVIWVKDRLSIKSSMFIVVSFTFIILFTANILPMKLGYIGSAGLPFIGFVMLTMLTMKMDELDIKKAMFIGLNLVIIVLVRRWFSYVAVSYFIAIPSIYLLLCFVNRDFNHEKFKSFLLNMFISGVSALLILAVGFFPLLKTFITYDYQLAYQSAKIGGYLYALEWFKTFYSPLITALFILGLIEGIMNRKLRFLTLAYSASILIIILLFYRIQVFGSHHYYIINMYVAFVTILGFVFLFTRIPKKISPIIGLFLIIAMVANFALLFVKREGTLINRALDFFQPLSTSLYYPPRYREDVDTIRDIATYLDETPKDHEYVYVLAGSADFTDDVLRNAWFPEKLNSVRNIEPTRQLDTRDGVPSLFFKYSYVVVTDPIQYHNGEEFQRVIGILADGMLHDEELRAYYYLEKTFTIKDDIKVYIYKLIEDIPFEIIDKYSKKFKALYPDLPFLYEFVY